jgi:hypothetical protein
MMKTITSLALATAVVAGSSIATSTSTEADVPRRLGAGIAAGVIAGTVLGAYAYGAPRYYAPPPAYAYSSGGSCYRGPRQCDWAGRSCWFNRWGERVCSGGEWRCWRPTICD